VHARARAPCVSTTDAALSLVTRAPSRERFDGETGRGKSIYPIKQTRRPARSFVRSFVRSFLRSRRDEAPPGVFGYSFDGLIRQSREKTRRRRRSCLVKDGKALKTEERKKSPLGEHTEPPATRLLSRFLALRATVTDRWRSIPL